MSNLECTVLPPLKFVAAIPELAHGRATSPLALTYAKIALHTNVLPYIRQRVKNIINKSLLQK